MTGIQKRIPIGSHITSKRSGYTHHGIYIGRGKVIHYSGFSELGKFDGIVEKVSLTDFQADGGEVCIYASPEDSPYSPNEIVNRAKSKLGEEKYNVFTNNCEHFANWCFRDAKRSAQVQSAVIATVAAVAIGIGIMKLASDD